MPIQVEYQPNEICVLHVTGTLKQSEFATTQKDLARKIDTGSKPRVLAIVENFEGWEQGADWNDLDFLVTHSGDIAKIAVVADSRWEVQALAFAGAGVRKAPVRFFPTTEIAEARNWIRD
jgi:stage II sporulation SpoAA-like protein